MDLDLTDRVVLITGGSDGLGAAAARTLLREGARVGICARDEARLQERAAELSRDGGDVLAVRADVRDPAAIEAFVDAAVRRWGRIDGLINNAGGSSTGEFATLDDAQWAADLQLKLIAAVHAARVTHRHLKERGGAIVNVLSITAKAPAARSMPTSVSRAAGLAFTKALSREWGSDAIRVNSVLIGMIATGQLARAAAKHGVPVADYLTARASDAQIPLGRVGAAEEFGDLAAFLLSPRSSYITGSAIALDGGLATGL